LAGLAGVLVEEMVTDAAEVIVGVLVDEQFGPVVMLGLGGVLADVLHDIVFRIAPFNLQTAYEMIGELRGREFLEGRRGSPARDVDALAQTLVRLSDMALEWSDVVESIDINPLFVMRNGVTVGDCLTLPVPSRPSPDGPTLGPEMPECGSA